MQQGHKVADKARHAGARCHVVPSAVSNRRRGVSCISFGKSRVGGYRRSFLAACRVATAKLAVNLEGKVDLARLSPWMAAYTAGLPDACPAQSVLAELAITADSPLEGLVLPCFCIA